MTQRIPTENEGQKESRLEVAAYAVIPALQRLGKYNHRSKPNLAYTLMSHVEDTEPLSSKVTCWLLPHDLPQFANEESIGF